MKFTEYAAESLEVKARFRSSNPRLAFLLEVGRYATIMALVIAVADLTPLTALEKTPPERLIFIGFVSFFMTLVEEVRLRLIGPQPSK